MNERIKELAEQTGVIFVPASKDDYFGECFPSTTLTDKMDLAKFAELIVEECALTLESITVPVSQCYEDFDNGYNKALLTGSTVIKQHFGVE